MLGAVQLTVTPPALPFPEAETLVGGAGAMSSRQKVLLPPGL